MQKVKSKKLEISVINTGSHPLPKYATVKSAGLDLHANLSGDSLALLPMERVLISTGLKMALPDGMEAQIRPRSGLALKKGLTVLNSPGTIDSDFTGEIKVMLVNLSGDIQTIENGERVAQMVLANVARLDRWDIVEELPETGRNSGGFGSTGKK